MLFRSPIRPPKECTRSFEDDDAMGSNSLIVPAAEADAPCRCPLGHHDLRSRVRSPSTARQRRPTGVGKVDRKEDENEPHRHEEPCRGHASRFSWSSWRRRIAGRLLRSGRHRPPGDEISACRRQPWPAADPRAERACGRACGRGARPRPSREPSSPRASRNGRGASSHGRYPRAASSS